MTLFWISTIILSLAAVVLIVLPFVNKKANNDEALRDEETGSEDIKNDMVPIQPSAKEQGDAGRGKETDETPEKQVQDENNLENENLDLA